MHGVDIDYGPCEDKGLIALLDELKEKGIRVRISLDFIDKKLTGYVTQEYGKRGRSMVAYNTRARRGKLFWADSVVKIEHSSKARGGTIWKKADGVVGLTEKPAPKKRKSKKK
jgi:hypothetical protein